MGANMRVLSGFGCFICGSLAVLLCAAPANPDRHLKAALARMDAMAAFAYSGAALERNISRFDSIARLGTGDLGSSGAKFQVPPFP
jgi:hypothetical protein